MRDTIDMAREAGLEGMTGHPALQRLVELARADERSVEREACAKVCDDALTKIWEYHSAEVRHAAGNVCTNLAAAIRNRGNT